MLKFLMTIVCHLTFSMCDPTLPSSLYSNGSLAYFSANPGLASLNLTMFACKDAGTLRPP